MIDVARLDERLNPLDAILIALPVAPDAIDTDECAALGKRYHDVRIAASQRVQVTDRDPARVDAGRLEHVKLPEGDLARNLLPGSVVVVREDRQIVLQMRLANRAKHLAFVGREIGFVRRVADLAVGAVPARCRFSDEARRNLILPHPRDFRGIGVLPVVPAARHHVDTRCGGNLAQVVVVHTHVRMSAVHDEHDAGLHRFFDVGDHGSDIGRRRRRKLQLALRPRIHAVKVLVEQDVADQTFGREILEDGPDARAFRKRDLACARPGCLPGRCRQQTGGRLGRGEQSEAGACAKQADGLPPTQSR